VALRQVATARDTDCGRQVEGSIGMMRGMVNSFVWFRRAAVWPMQLFVVKNA